jgi:sulfate adenylyltransferase subunit 1 (EFTu-like GTPase family)
MALTIDDNIPMNLWGKDHWTTLAYIETVMVDCGGFQIGRDARMKSNRRNFRVMAEDCPKPKRVGGNAGMAIVMKLEHSTKLNDGSVIDNHDDWCCIQDMAEAGLLTLHQHEIEPGVVIHFSELGRDVANKLREHKASGGNFAAFRFDQPAVPAA